MQKKFAVLYNRKGQSICPIENGRAVSAVSYTHLVDFCVQPLRKMVKRHKAGIMARGGIILSRISQSCHNIFRLARRHSHRFDFLEQLFYRHCHPPCRTRLTPSKTRIFYLSVKISHGIFTMSVLFYT